MCFALAAGLLEELQCFGFTMSCGVISVVTEFMVTARGITVLWIHNVVWRHQYGDRVHGYCSRNYSASADQHIPVQFGTVQFLILTMISAILILTMISAILIDPRVTKH